MKTGLTPAESMVVNGGERSNAALAGTIETESIPHLFERIKNPKTLVSQGFSGFLFYETILTLRNICGIFGV